MVLVPEYLITIPLLSWKLWGRKDRRGLFSNSCPPMDLEMRTTLALNLTMGNTADVCVWAFTDGVMKTPKKCDYANSVELRFSSKRVYMSYNP